MKQLKTGVILFFIIIACLPARSQSWYKQKTQSREIGYLSVGGQVNITNYFGDMNPLTQYVSTDIRGTRPSFAINVSRKITPRIFARASFLYGRLTADDFKAADPDDERHRYRFIRNTHFRNDIYELALVFTYDIIPSRQQYYKRAKYVPYILLGVAGIYHNPRAKTPISFGNKWVNLRPLRTEGQGLPKASDGSTYDKTYSLFQPAVPLGAGVRFKLTDRIDLSVEAAFRILFFDYIDDVGGDYANPADLTSDLARAMADRTMETIAARSGDDRRPERDKLLERLGYGAGPFNGFGNEGDKRGEGNNNDVYLVTGVHLNYILNVGLRCPKFR